MSELFDIPESKSPRLIWMEANEITTQFLDQCIESWSATCWKSGSFLTGYGDTELDAITDMARKLNLKLWNEQ
jgi:hypothetical protein